MNIFKQKMVLSLFHPFKVTPVDFRSKESGHQSYALTLKDVNYSVTTYKGPWWKGLCFREKIETHVLRNFTIRFNTGELTAILGESGAGKTSLLDFIAFQTTGKRQGQILLNNKICTKRFMELNSTYVVQSDSLLPNLTVRETLTFAAYLRQPHVLTPQQIDEKVKQVLQDLSLQSVADVKVGGLVRKVISGGERRRLSFGIHLMQDPKIMLVDEATTGLDSYSAMSIVKTLKKVAESGIIVLLTIHQPSSKMQGLFDKICIMSGGRLAFCGSPAQMITFYDRIGHPCPVYCNPFDFYVDLTGIDKRDRFRYKESYDRVTSLVEVYARSPEYQHICHSPGDTVWSHKLQRLESRQLDSGCTQMKSTYRMIKTLLRRMTLNVFRDRALLLSRVFLISVMAPFILGFLGKLDTGQSGVQDRVGLLYNTLIIPPYMACVLITFVFPRIKKQYLKERMDHLYSPFVFISSYLLHSFPFQVVSCTLFSIIVYWSSGLQPFADKFFMYLAVTILLNMFGEIMMVGAMFVFRNHQMAANCVTLFLTMTLLTGSGLLRSLKKMSAVFRYLSWGTLHKYATEILVESEFSGLSFSCAQGEHCEFSTGEEYLQDYFPDANGYYTRNFLVLMAQYFGYVAIAVFLIVIHDYRKY